ncbi:DUF4185 domain-containing protein [Gordonia sp. X0973]|uniref:DUF4185 domain-containing protein n=1 Tax=Gordonia sp. X0973 TaxID=2742602 RepID=UPI000F5233E2|nr:DUF4185 domain-containing protein [Gordonia sp. X0973]QKT08907.1 DUF4185 domain-containing protein [Gordonia sp. X0973]
MSVNRALATGIAVSLAAVTLAATPSVSHASPCNALGPVGHDFGSTGSAGSSRIGMGSLDFGSYSAPGKKPQMPLIKLHGGPTETIQWVTGPLSPNRTDKRFSITATDVGVPWDNGSGQVLMAFGDTWGKCNGALVWRHNTMLRANGNSDLSKGITFPNAVPGNSRSGASVTSANPTFAQPITNAVGVKNIEVGRIPTAAISIGGVQYLAFMSIARWGEAGRWETNFSAIASSRNNGQTWTVEPSTIRSRYELNIPGVPATNTGQGRFQVSSFLRRGPWVYQYGTPNGRYGALFLSRVPANQILNLGAYQYYRGGGRWSGYSGDAARVATEPIAEVSVRYNNFLKRFIMLSSRAGSVTMRTAAKPEGPWSGPRVIIPSSKISGLYAPYIWPRETGSSLYFVVSRWKDYNVMLARTDLAGL